MKIAKYFGYFVLATIIAVSILEWRTKPDTRIMAETLYECDFSLEELSSNLGLFSSYVIGMYWFELREAEYNTNHIPPMVNMLYSIHDVYGSKCDEIIFSKLAFIKQNGFDFSAHRTESNRALILGAVLLQNKGMVEWLLNNDGYTDVKIDREKSKYHEMNIPQLAKALDKKHSNETSRYILTAVTREHHDFVSKVEY